MAIYSSSLYFRNTDANSAGATFQVIGSEATGVIFGGLRYLTATDKAKATWSFILDNGSTHITKTNFSANGTSGADIRQGTLDVGLQGGVLLSGQSTFDLISTPFINSATDFGTGPGPLWIAGLEDGATEDTVNVTLAAGANKGSLDVAGTTSASFAAASYGYVALANVTGDSFPVYLDVDGGTLSNFQDALTEAGWGQVGFGPKLTESTSV